MAKLADCLAINLVRIRNARGLSQGELAERADLSRGTIAKYELATGGATLETIALLAKILEVEESELLADPATVARAELATHLLHLAPKSPAQPLIPGDIVGDDGLRELVDLLRGKPAAIALALRLAKATGKKPKKRGASSSSG